jgi:6-phosphogluconolactonase
MARLEIAEIRIVKPEDVAKDAASWIADRLKAAILARGSASIALSGGNTPKKVYEALAGFPLEWPGVHFYFGDERCVPPDHPDSNYRMAKEALFDRVGATLVHRMHGERDDQAAAASDYAKELPDSIDVVLLGMGEDGHTASLFPGTDWSRPTGRKVIAVSGAPKPPPQRLSITPDVIWDAGSRLVLATGSGKAEQVRRALEGDADPEHYPVHTAKNATWLLDPDAATLLAK